MKRNSGTAPTSLERLMARALTELGVAYEREVQIGPYRADFSLTGTNIIIECDGEFWHRLRKSKDQRRDKYMAACGYSVYRAEEWAIKQDAKACVRAAMKTE